MNDPLNSSLPVSNGELVKDLGDNVLHCVACGHLCKLRPGQRGVCLVRWNEDGVLKVPFGYTAGLQNDPIEKKPFFHALPGSRAMSFGMLGCDFKCAYCQNWFSSQTFRDPEASSRHSSATPESLCDTAEAAGSRTIVSTYNEPLITAEWGVAVFREARSRGLKTAFVSNGHGTPEVLNYLSPWIDFYKVDLKSFSEKNYRRLGGNLPSVLDTIKHLHTSGIWLEIVTLVIPGYNDSDSELNDIAQFIAKLSIDIPWHITAFHPDYKMQDRERTPPETLLRAWEIGHKAGLNYVYSGNLPGKVNENTYCPDCGLTLVERYGFQVIANRIIDSACPKCRCKIPGCWE